MAKKTRVLAGVLALLMVLFALSASILALSHAHVHEHGNGAVEDCEICQHISALAENLKKLFAPVAIIAAAALLVRFLSDSLALAGPVVSVRTPVTLRVKLSN